MKKFFILFAVVALMATTACNEKPAKDKADGQKNETEKVEAKQDTAKAVQQPKINVDKAAPTADGKDHTVADFKTKEYQVRLENLADGTYRLTLLKDGKANQVVETKQCVLQGSNYLMRDDSGKNYIIKAGAGNEEITIMDKKNITYHGGVVK